MSAGVRLRFGLGATDDVDGMNEDHDGFIETRWDGLGPSVIEEGFRIGLASDFWNRYEEDVQLAKELGGFRAEAQRLKAIHSPPNLGELIRGGCRATKGLDAPGS